MLVMTIGEFEEGSIDTSFLPFPTARIATCGGLITAENPSMSNIPKFDMLNDPPWNSLGWSFPWLAFADNS